LPIPFSMAIKYEVKKVPIVIAIITIVGCAPIAHFTSKEQQDISIKETKFATKAEKIDFVRQKIIEEANKWLGTPYCLGGTTNCVDCSGLIQNVYRNIGIILPRTAAEQSQKGAQIDKQEISIGDLLFFGNRKRVTHVAIYVGNNEVIHASSTRGVVRDKLDSNLMSNFLFAKRVIENN